MICHELMAAGLPLPKSFRKKGLCAHSDKYSNIYQSGISGLDKEDKCTVYYMALFADPEIFIYS